MALNSMCSKRKSRDWVDDDDDDDERESFMKLRCEQLCAPIYNPFESDFYYSFYYDDDDAEFDHQYAEDDASSVGSNQFIDEIVLISDDDESRNSPVQENRGCSVVEERGNHRQVFLENYTAAAAIAEQEEQERLFLMNCGPLIIDNYGNLLGEFQHLDDDLIIPE